MNDLCIMSVLQRSRNLKRYLDHAFELIFIKRNPVVEIALLSNRHHEVAIVLAAVFLHLRVDQLNDIRVIESPQNIDFPSEARDPIISLQSLEREQPFMLSLQILDDKHMALPAFLQALLDSPASAVNLRHPRP
jgi:hypothetical protein